MKSLFNTLKLKIPDIDTDFCFISDDADFHDAFKKKHNSCDVRLVEFILGLEQNRSLQDLVSELETEQVSRRNFIYSLTDSWGIDLGSVNKSCKELQLLPKLDIDLELGCKIYKSDIEFELGCKIYKYNQLLSKLEKYATKSNGDAEEIISHFVLDNEIRKRKLTNLIYYSRKVPNFRKHFDTYLHKGKEGMNNLIRQLLEE